MMSIFLWNRATYNGVRAQEVGYWDWMHKETNLLQGEGSRSAKLDYMFWACVLSRNSSIMSIIEQ